MIKVQAQQGAPTPTIYSTEQQRCYSKRDACVSSARSSAYCRHTRHFIICDFYDVAKLKEQNRIKVQGRKPRLRLFILQNNYIVLSARDACASSTRSPANLNSTSHFSMCVMIVSILSRTTLKIVVKFHDYGILKYKN